VKFPRLALLLLVTAILVWCLGVLYTAFVDPEIKFWTAAATKKLQWVEKMRQKHGYVIGVVGGSTTTFGIDAEHIEREHRLPVANLGLHVGMGPEACVGFGFAALKKGDVLVLSLEPSMLGEDTAHVTPLAAKLEFSLPVLRDIFWLSESRSPVATKLGCLKQLQPGGYHAITMLGKLASGQPLYRYSVNDMRPGGLQVTKDRRSFAKSDDYSHASELQGLSREGRELLVQVSEEASKRGIHVFYVLPWAYWPTDGTKERRAANAKLLDDIELFVPVIREPALGVNSELANFADSGQHLTEDAAPNRSDCLVKALSSTGHQPPEARK
jgi:hypothetical protein